MTEADFTREVLALAARRSLLAHWCRDSRSCEGRPGLTDLIIASDKAVMFAELKMPWADTDSDQDMWLWSLQQIADRNRNVYVRVYIPEDLENGTIADDFRYCLEID